MARKSRSIPEINAGSMADIAFLLLIFFLVTTTMDTDKGLRVKLPPYSTEPPEQTKQYERNVLEVLVNSNDQLLVERQLMNIEELTKITKEHLLNEGRNPKLAVTSTDAVVSLKNDRGTSYERYVEVYNELLRAYNEVMDEYAQRKFGRDFDELKKNGVNKKEVKDKFPLKISEAEPVGYGDGGN